MSYTPNLSLMLTPEDDRTTTFHDWRIGMNGEGFSNMTKIDGAIGDLKRVVAENSYSVDISKVNKVGSNQALCIEIPGITELSELNGKVIAVTTGAYCWRGKNNDDKTPDKLYLRINDSTLGNKIQGTIKRQIPSYTGVDYDTDSGHTYFTDYYMPGEIARYQTLLIAFRDNDIMLLNPAPAPKATKAIEADSSDNVSYVTPNAVAKALSDKAPVAHASTDTIYGVGDSTHYGHVTLTDISNTLQDLDPDYYDDIIGNNRDGNKYDSNDGTAVTPFGVVVLASHVAKNMDENRARTRSSTIVVAASDSAPNSKLAADYVCDGTDDQKEITAAISALPKTGGEIILLEGTYKLSSSITVSKSNITISGVGWGTKLESSTSSEMSILFSSCENCIVKDLYGHMVTPRVIGNAQSPSSYHRLEGLNLYLSDDDDMNSGVMFKYAKFCSISNCILKGFNNDIHCNNTTSITIANNILINPASAGIYISSSSASIIVSSNIIWQDGVLTNGQKGINIVDATCNHCIIDSNICYHNYTNIYVNGSWNTISNNQTIQCSALSSGPQPKSIHVAGSGTNNIISNNIITNTTYTNDGGVTNVFANNK